MAAGRAIAETPVRGATVDGDAERRWLATLQQLAAGVAHELRNALNGAAVNLEVVRSRSARDGVPATALGSFAGSASDQLEQVIAMTDALMALARAGHEPVAIGRMTDQVAALVRPVLAAGGGSLDLAVEGEGTTRVPATAARLFVATTVLAAVQAARADGHTASDAQASLCCRVRPVSDGQPVQGVELRVEGTFARTPVLDEEIIALAKEYGVGLQPATSSITSTFPA